MANHHQGKKSKAKTGKYQRQYARTYKNKANAMKRHVLANPNDKLHVKTTAKLTK